MPLDMTDLNSDPDLMQRYGWTAMDHEKARPVGAQALRVFDERGEELPGWHRIVRADNGKTLNVVGDSYTLLDNRRVFGAFEEAIAASGLDARGIMVGTDYGNEGRKTFRQYVFPAHTEQVKAGVDVALRIVLWNSYDGSLAFHGRAGLLTWVCANTAVTGTEVGNFRVKHTGDIDVEACVKGLVEAAEGHVQKMRRLREWPRIDVTDQQAQALISALDGASDAQIDRLVHQWVRAKDDQGPQGGATLWTLYGVMTAWSTHGDDAVGAMATREAKRGGVSFGNRRGRERTIAKLIEGVEWKEVEEA